MNFDLITFILLFHASLFIEYIVCIFISLIYIVKEKIINYIDPLIIVSETKNSHYTQRLSEIKKYLKGFKNPNVLKYNHFEIKIRLVKNAYFEGTIKFLENNEFKYLFKDSSQTCITWKTQQSNPFFQKIYPILTRD